MTEHLPNDGRGGAPSRVGATAWVLVALVLVAVVAFAWLAVRERSGEAPKAGVPAGRPLPVPTRPEPPGSLLDVPCVERSGSAMRTGDLAGRFVVADFIFTHCDATCRPLTRALRRLQEATAGVPDLVLVSFSVDPARDTEEKLAAYAEEHGADPDRWLFLRCAEADVRRLVASELKLSSEEALLTHSNRFVLFDRGGKARRLYLPLEDEEWLDALLADLAALRREAP